MRIGNRINVAEALAVTDDEALARHAKHLTTTAKIPHPYEFVHDEVGYNYRLPNLNAALGCAQMERLPEMLPIPARTGLVALTLSPALCALILKPGHHEPGCIVAPASQGRLSIR